MRNIVTPLKTPWMVSTTERELNLEEAGNQLIVKFLGFFGNFLPNDKDKYQDVQVTFSAVKDSRYFPEYSKEDSNRLDGYNWEKLPEFRNESGSLASHEKIFNKVWNETKVCPNPSAYEMINSSWVNEKKSYENLKHYLILVADYNLEVLAESCSADQ